MKAIYVSHMGSDADVANDARISYDSLAEMFTKEQNDNLIRFLARGLKTSDWKGLIYDVMGAEDYEKAEQLVKDIKRISTHWTPFAHNAIKIRMQAPLPQRTQCFKHKQGLVENEESRRYISTTPEFYTPVFRKQAKDKKQGSGEEFVGIEQQTLQKEYTDYMNTCILKYKNLLKANVAEEQARYVLPQGCEVNWVWTGNLFAFANFYNKRSALDSQKETQILAKEVSKIIQPLFPVSWEALTS